MADERTTHQIHGSEDFAEAVLGEAEPVLVDFLGAVVRAVSGDRARARGDRA
jgi:hypothetical protein